MYGGREREGVGGRKGGCMVVVGEGVGVVGEGIDGGGSGCCRS